LRENAPKKYPCLARCQCIDLQNEEFGCFYLYERDLLKYMAQLQKAKEFICKKCAAGKTFMQPSLFDNIPTVSFVIPAKAGLQEQGARTC